MQVVHAIVMPDDRRPLQGALKVAKGEHSQGYLVNELFAHAALGDLQSVPAVLGWSADNCDGGKVTSILFELVPGNLLDDIHRRAEIMAATHPAHPQPSPDCLLYSPVEYWPVIVTLARVIDTAHERDYIHMDIKPENILVDARGKVMLADWGLHCGPKHGEPRPVVVDGPWGTKGYCLPELGAGGQGVPVHHSMDTQPLALTVLAMLFNMAPECARCLHGQDKLEGWLKFDPVLKDLVISTLNADPAVRVPVADWHRRCPVEYLVPPPSIPHGAPPPHAAGMTLVLPPDHPVG